MKGAQAKTSSVSAGAQAPGDTLPGWVCDEEGRLKRETKPHMGRRLPGFDYAQRRIYEITIVLEERRPILGRLVKRGEGDWAVEPSAVGEAVLKCWSELPALWPQVELIASQLMPDHFHGILFVKERLPKGKSLGNVVGAFKSRSTSEALKLLAARGEGRDRGGFIETALPGAIGAGQGLARGRERPRFWASGYVDSILFGKGQLKKMINYLRDNPRRLGVKREHPELFKVTRELVVDGVGRFSAIGNHFLLTRPSFHQVQVSRRFFAYARDEHGNLLKDAPPAVATREFAEKPMTRVDALVLNRVAQLIAGEGACEIDYKGATLANVDEEVKKLV